MSTLAAGASVEPQAIVSLMWIAAASLAAVLLSYLTRKHVPGVVFLLFLGVLIGPDVLGVAKSDAHNMLLRELGLGMLFLLAGWEIDPKLMRGRSGASTSLTWLASIGVAFLVALVGGAAQDAQHAIVLAIAVSSTAVGTLLPVIKNEGIANTPVGRGVLAHGAIGELGPVFAMALLLSARSTFLSFVVLAIFVAGALVTALVPKSVKVFAPWMHNAVYDGASATTQAVMRGVILLLLVLMAMAAVFQLDVVLGAFAAGIILRGLVPEADRPLVESRLDVMGYGLLIPIFFVMSGMAIKIDVVFTHPLAILAGVGTILVARGLPVFLAELLSNTGLGLRGYSEKLQLALYSATGLPIIVAVTEVAESKKLISGELGSTLVCAGAVTVLIFPLLAKLVARVSPGEQRTDESEAANDEDVAARVAGEAGGGRDADAGAGSDAGAAGDGVEGIEATEPGERA